MSISSVNNRGRVLILAIFLGPFFAPKPRVTFSGDPKTCVDKKCPIKVDLSMGRFGPRPIAYITGNCGATVKQLIKVIGPQEGIVQLDISQATIGQCRLGASANVGEPPTWQEKPLTFGKKP